MRAPSAKVFGGLVATVVAGCASAPVTMFTTVPAGATIYVDDKVVCARTPCGWQAEPALPSSLAVRASLAGHHDAALTVERQVTWPGAVKAITFGAIGWLTGTAILIPVGVPWALATSSPPERVHLSLVARPRPPAPPRPPPEPDPEEAPPPRDQPAPQQPP